MAYDEPHKVLSQHLKHNKVMGEKQLAWKFSFLTFSGKETTYVCPKNGQKL